MATIAFIMQPAIGHLNPTFKLARDLQAFGHRVYYLGVECYQEFIRSRGFEHVAFSSDALTTFYNHLQQLKFSLDSQKIHGRFWEVLSSHQEEIDQSFLKDRPDLAIVDSNLLAIALTPRRLGIRTILLNPMLPLGDSSHALAPFVDRAMLGRLSAMPELILCPEEFDVPGGGPPTSRPRFYTESSIDLQRRERSFQWDKISTDRPLIYCSLGSHTYSEAGRLFETTLGVFAKRAEWQLIVSTGSELRASDFNALPPNVVIDECPPQLQILKRASCMITHGGLGSVKECIFFGVPMVVFPFIWDQPRNAAKVEFHGLGLMGSFRRVNIQQMESLIERVLVDLTFKTRVELMGKRFREKEDSKLGAKLIQQMLLQDDLLYQSTRPEE
jgi:UDP:flavonoid glycosyltransferase YjiC (YdhE family)